MLDFVQFLKIKTVKKKKTAAITGEAPLKKMFSKLIEQIGLSSTGGNSVEDVRMERQR